MELATGVADNDRIKHVIINRPSVMSILKRRKIRRSPKATNIKAYGVGEAGTIGKRHRGYGSLKGSDNSWVVRRFQRCELPLVLFPGFRFAPPWALMSVAVGDQNATLQW